MRKKLVEETVELIAKMRLPHPVRVGIDGASASGKTRFADSLVEPLKQLGRDVIRVSIDGFHNPPEIRYRRGEDSVDGYIEDSFDKESVIKLVLDPLGPSGNREYKVSLYDFVTNRQTLSAFKQAQPDSILIFDGVLLFCDLLGDLFDFRILVEAEEDRLLRRALVRDCERLGGVDRVRSKYSTRYLPGQRRYFDLYRPHQQAHLVVDNNDFDAPFFVAKNQPQLVRFG